MNFKFEVTGDEEVWQLSHKLQLIYGSKPIDNNEIYKKGLIQELKEKEKEHE